MADLSTTRETPVVDFTSEDFDSLSADIERYAQAQYADRWTDFNADQFAVVFKDILCFIGDQLHFNLNAKLREAFMVSALRRQSIQNAQKPFEIELRQAEQAGVKLKFALNPAGAYPFTIGRSTTIVSNGGAGDDEVFFYPVTDKTIAAAVPGNIVYVDALEGTLFADTVLAVSDGTKSMRAQLPQQNVLLEGLSVRVGAEVWAKTLNFANVSSTGKVYKVVNNDLGDTFIVFGDGVYGAIPGVSQTIYSTFAAGGGIRGNLGKDVVKTIVLAHANVLSVTNEEKSSGGRPEASLKEARRAVPAALYTLKRIVTASDAAKLAQAVVGVSAAYATPGYPVGSRQIFIYIAPAGGGVPGDTLRNKVITDLRGKRMLTNRLRVFGPVYRPLRFEVLLHVSPNFRAGDVEQLAREAFLNSKRTGQLDFSQLGFGGVDEVGTVLLAQTRLQTTFRDLSGAGLDRAEIVRLDVDPQPRARDAGNTGNGVFGAITTTGRQRRRTYSVEVASGSTYNVRELLVGFVGKITDTSLTDEAKVYQEEGVTSFAGKKLYPDRAGAGFVLLASATDQTAQVAAGSASVYTLTETGAEYAVEIGVTRVALGAAYVDTQISFTLSQGSTVFSVGDAFEIDVYPKISDIRLRADEYPELSDANFVTRTSGGSRT